MQKAFEDDKALSKYACLFVPLLLPEKLKESLQGCMKYKSNKS